MFWNGYIIGSTWCVHPQRRPHADSPSPSPAQSTGCLQCCLRDIGCGCSRLKDQTGRRGQSALLSPWALLTLTGRTDSRTSTVDALPAGSCRRHWLISLPFLPFFKNSVKNEVLTMCSLFVLHHVQSIRVSGETYVSIFQCKNVSEHRLLRRFFPLL